MAHPGFSLWGTCLRAGLVLAPEAASLIPENYQKLKKTTKMHSVYIFSHNINESCVRFWRDWTENPIVLERFRKILKFSEEHSQKSII